MQYLNAKFPLKYVYSGAHGMIHILPKRGEGNVLNHENQGRQSTDVLVFFLFCFVFCFFLFFFFVS